MGIQGNFFSKFRFQTRSRKPVKIENRSALQVAEFGKAQPAPVAKGYVIADIV
jgi:hypothetical protein